MPDAANHLASGCPFAYLAPQHAMKKAIHLKLFVMMALEFFIWGCWLPLIYGYLPSLGFSDSTPPELISSLIPHKLWFLFSQQSLVLNAFPVAAIIGMFFSTQYADRHFSAEKFMAFSHFVGGAAILGLAFTRSFPLFFALMLIHCLLYVPTISIANSIAFANLKDAQKEFACSSGRDHRLGSGGVALYVHPGGLGQSSQR